LTDAFTHNLHAATAVIDWAVDVCQVSAYFSAVDVMAIYPPHHANRGFTAQTLKVLTIIHNLTSA